MDIAPGCLNALSRDCVGRGERKRRGREKGSRRESEREKKDERTQREKEADGRTEGVQ